MDNRGFTILNYLDDFAGAEKAETAQLAFNTLGNLLKELGLTESPNKLCPPAIRMSFLGIQFDTEKLTLEVTPERLVEIAELLNNWKAKSYTNRNQIEALIGKLMFITRCVRSSRVFMTRSLDALHNLETGSDVPIGQEFKKDLEWWSSYLHTFNGTVMMPCQDWTQPDSVFAVDACMTGIGAICWQAKQVFHLELPEEFLARNHHINELECLCLVVALKLWSPWIKHKQIIIFSDNMVTVTIVNTGRSKNSYLQACLREIAFILCVNEAELRTVHIEGRNNRIPDYLSRWHLKGNFKALFWDEMTKCNLAYSMSELQVPTEMLELSSTWQ